MDPTSQSQSQETEAKATESATLQAQIAKVLGAAEALGDNLSFAKLAGELRCELPRLEQNAGGRNIEAHRFSDAPYGVERALPGEVGEEGRAVTGQL